MRNIGPVKIPLYFEYSGVVNCNILKIS